MKNIIMLLVCSFFFGVTYSQVSSVGMKNEFKEFASMGRIQAGEGLQTYSSGNVKGSQFFSETWSTGSVTGVNKVVFSNNYLFLYDKVRQELFIRPKDTDLIVLVDKSQILSFTINTDKAHLFYRASMYDPSQEGNFVEVLVQNDKYSLLKVTKTNFVPANPNDMEKVKQGEFQDEFVDHVNYYIFSNNKIEKVNLSEYGIRKVTKPEKTKVDDFFSLHSNDEVDERLLINLINSLNS
jgi:hypothetical protein